MKKSTRLRLVALALFVGGFGPLLVYMLLSLLVLHEDKPEDRLAFGLVLLVSMSCFLGLLILFANLYSRRSKGDVTRIKAGYSAFWGGPLGLLWGLFLLADEPKIEEGIGRKGQR